MSEPKPSWHSRRWLRIFGGTLILTIISRELAGWTGWLIMVAGLGFGYLVAATETPCGLFGSANAIPITPALAKDDGRCHAGRDGDCYWDHCPQIRDGEPVKTGRHCPNDNRPDDEQW